MKQGTLLIEGRVIVPKLWLARDPFSRFMGLMGRKGLPQDEALLFTRCNSVHTCFMRFPIDVVLFDADGKVVEVIENMKTWRFLAPRMKAKHCIEFTGGRAGALGVKPGVQLEWKEIKA